MITQFENGFITKTKLNELVDGINANTGDITDTNATLSNIVDGINANTGDITDINATLSNIVVLNSNMTKTIGTGGDFTTITKAFEWCSRVIPTKYKVTLQLLTGFTWSELVTINDVDFGFVILTSADGTVNTSLNPVSSGFAFTATNSVCPMWKLLLNGGNYQIWNGVKLDNSTMIMSNAKGIIGFATKSLHLKSSKLSPEFNTDLFFLYHSQYQAQISGTEVFLEDNSTLECRILKSSRLVAQHGCNIKVKEILYTNFLSIFENYWCSAYAITGLGSNDISIDVWANSKLHIRAKWENELEQNCIFRISANYNSSATCQFVSAPTLLYLEANMGSTINVYGSSFVSATVSYGGFITANGSTGTLSQTANTITANGIIFK